MFKKFFKKLIGILFAIIFVMIITNANTGIIYSIPDNFSISYDDIKEINENNILGEYVNATIIDEINVDNSQSKTAKMVIKLFGFLPIKEVSVNVIDDTSVYVGGIPLGFSIKTKGVIVVGENSVVTENGEVITKKSDEIKSGDIIIKINECEINEPKDIQNYLINNNVSEVTLEIIRDEKHKFIKVNPVLDKETNTYKLGLWVRNDASGIGTLSFVACDNLRFGALGHPITDYETGLKIPVNTGEIYNCTMLGIKKGTKGEPGELRCLFMQGKDVKGTIDKNSNYGVFGQITDTKNIIDENLIYDVCSRLNIKVGKASIVSSISGIRESYDIEIIKTNYQPKSSDKSFIFRVTDKRLLDKTGGIVQGMSGSPIVQDGKIIGAVTHVFVSDPTKGYGIYADWMIEE